MRETLKTMSAVIAERASIGISLLGSGLTEEAMYRDEAIGAAVRRCLAELRDAFAEWSVLRSPAQ